MSCLVSLESLLGGSSVVAFVTREWSLASMTSFVHFQVLGVAPDVAALTTFVLLLRFFACLGLPVQKMRNRIFKQSTFFVGDAETTESPAAAAAAEVLFVPASFFDPCCHAD